MPRRHALGGAYRLLRGLQISVWARCDSTSSGQRPKAQRAGFDELVWSALSRPARQGPSGPWPPHAGLVHAWYRSGVLTRISHQFATASPYSSGLTAFRSLDVLHEYDCGGLGRKPCQSGASTVSLRKLMRKAGKGGDMI